MLKEYWQIYLVYSTLLEIFSDFMTAYPKFFSILVTLQALKFIHIRVKLSWNQADKRNSISLIMAYFVQLDRLSSFIQTKQALAQLFQAHIRANF